MNFKKEDLLLYAITDRKEVSKEELYRQIEEALKGGVTILQLREKKLSEDDFIEEAIKVKEICRRYNVPLIINDNVIVAIKSGADGVHVGLEDMAVCDIRSLAPEGFIIGATAKTIEQAQRAEREGADYIGVGAVFPSPTKTNAVRITKEQLKEITSAVAIPAVAIGGITYENMDELKGTGICGIAVVSAIFGAKDVRAAAETLLLRAST